MRSVLLSLRETLQLAKDSWNKFCAGAAVGLPQFDEHTAQLAGRAAGLPEPALVRLLLAERGLLNRESNRSRALEVPTHGVAEAVEIPLLGRVAAGVPIEAISNPDTIAVPSDWLGLGETFALRVRGDSMIDAHIEDGDVV